MRHQGLKGRVGQRKGRCEPEPEGQDQKAHGDGDRQDACCGVGKGSDGVTQHANGLEGTPCTVSEVAAEQKHAADIKRDPKRIFEDLDHEAVEIAGGLSIDQSDIAFCDVGTEAELDDVDHKEREKNQARDGHRARENRLLGLRALALHDGVLDPARTPLVEMDGEGRHNMGQEEEDQTDFYYIKKEAQLVQLLGVGIEHLAADEEGQIAR